MNKRMMVEIGVAGAIVATAAVAGVVKLIRKPKPDITVVKEEDLDFKEE